MKFVLSGAFGELEPVRNGVPHTGIDLKMNVGTTLRSVTDGVVYALRDYGSENIGKGVVVKMDNGNYAIYGHMSRFSVEKGQRVAAGQEIGLSGNTGNSTGPHLHFGIQKPNGEFLDPTIYKDKLDLITGKQDFWAGWDSLFNTDQTSNVDTYHEPPHFVMDWLFSKMAQGGSQIWDWIMLVLPEIVGYATIGAGIFIILASMMGKTGMLKTLGWYFGLVILALCILSSI